MSRTPGKPATKLARLHAAIAAGNWPAALSIAARFPRLGTHAVAIRRAHEAYRHPNFYTQLGYDVDCLLADGRAALIARYGSPRRKAKGGAS